MTYREYDRPIEVIFITPDKALGRGKAIGVRETPLPSGKSNFHFLVQTTDGPVLVRQADVVG